MIKDNLYYFNYSMDNPDPIWDKDFYPFYPVEIDKNEFENIVNFELALHSLDKDIIDEDISTLIKLLRKKGCGKSYFSMFLRTCDLSSDELIDEKYFSEKERVSAMKQVISIYRLKRKNIYTDKSSLQAYEDAQTAKRRSSAGEDKVIKLSGLKHAYHIDEIDNKIAKISKLSGNFSLKKIKDKFKIKFKFSHRDKSPDCIFRINDALYLLEAKHINGTGGAQNGSIGELISFIEIRESIPNIHYISFLDGCYSRYLAVIKEKSTGTKLEMQKYRIIETLKENKNNYFLNTAGFKKLIADLRGWNN